MLLNMITGVDLRDFQCLESLIVTLHVLSILVLSVEKLPGIPEFCKVLSHIMFGHLVYDILVYCDSLSASSSVTYVHYM